MQIEIVALNREDGSAIEFAITESGRVGSYAYEYLPNSKTALPVKFDKAKLEYLLKDDSFELLTKDSTPRVLLSKFLKTAISALIK